MKRFIKRLLDTIWGWTSPVRRRIYRGFEGMIARSAPRAPGCTVTEETGVLMDLMVRELVRLQKQVEEVQQLADEIAPSRARAAQPMIGDERKARNVG